MATRSVVELIRHKREGGAFSEDEIGELVTGYTTGKIPDYQMSALLMAIVWRGMSRAETVALTLAMAASGEQLRIRERVSPVADKHSTGGVGDKVTLAVAPLVARVRVAGREDVWPGAGAHRRHGGQARIHQRLPHRIDTG